MIVIIDFGLGNIASVTNALERLGVSYEISNNPKVIKKALAIILPGVGAAGAGMKNLKIRNLDKIIFDEVKTGKPILGICLGMQLLFEKSEEGNVKCLEILEGTVRKFKKTKKVPQIGWNSIGIVNYKSEIMNNINDKSYVYFVNSYYCKPLDEKIILTKTKYGENFASIVEKDNVVGMQFHPEKSGKVGFQLLKNFIKNYVN